MTYRWQHLPPGNPTTVQELSQALNISPLLSNLLVQRGINTFEEARHFFRPVVEDLHDPMLMKDMDAAVERINRALENDERILVFGDYDVDGTTSVALMYGYLNQHTSNLDYYIPDRYTEGYGLSIQGMDYASNSGVGLIIALDCGTKALTEIKYAQSAGIDVIVCDHHRPGDELPPVVALLNPKQEGCNYPYDELPGCAIGFKLIQALAATRNIEFSELEPLLDLVVVSIASDIVPITGENRTLAALGLQRLQTQPRKGLETLLIIAQTGKDKLTISDIVFQIGPRINAAGRMQHGKQAVELLLAETEDEAQKTGMFLQEFNTDRKDLDREITNEALAMIDGDDWLRSANSTVLFNEHWHKGVVGIVASRVIESHYRPTVILTQSEGKATGSARSVKGFDVYNAINACSDLLENFGGHKYAAGLTMTLDNVPKFRERFETAVAAEITDEMRMPVINVDSDLDFNQIDGKLFRILRQFGPFGPGNSNPVFRASGVRDAGGTRKVGGDGEHLKLDLVQDGTNVRASGIAFKQGHHYDSFLAGKAATILYSLEENEWNGKRSIQLRVRDVRFE